MNSSRSTGVWPIAQVAVSAPGDAEGFAQVDSVAPIRGVGPGQRVSFGVRIDNPVGRGLFTQQYRFALDLTGDSSATLQTTPVVVTVPGILRF